MIEYFLLGFHSQNPRGVSQPYVMPVPEGWMSDAHFRLLQALHTRGAQTDMQINTLHTK